ncbi:DUF4296 domain-containing protein [Changchengzhania lutea]|uniref:DUF4296 domain-containing protein n=1 Tax=Changchengzhania lutea TaxID=2049305 RepID=UPI00115D87A6|nr:DUF4296 domain-containing protein [Changchengzhania lutea]
MILKRFSTYLMIALLTTACYQFKEPKKPEDLISKSKMVAVLIDIKLIGSINGVNKRVIDQKGIDLMEYVFEKHQIDSLQFAKSNDYYAYYVKDYEAIYERVKDSLDVLHTFYKDADLKEMAEKRIQDSLKLLNKTDDSLKLRKLRDSLGVKFVNDSIKKVIKRDSLVEFKLEEQIEAGELIKPISEIEPQ